MRPAVIGLTAAGLHLDPDCRVLDTLGRVISGLYAAGETLGCFHGKRSGGGGIGIGSAVIFGRKAGEEAARAARIA
jgi:fumarate reductase flavoprotein subunit